MPDIALFQTFFQVPFLIKIVVVILLLFYAIFTLIVLNQIRTMGKIIHTSSSHIMSFVAIIQVLLALSLFVVSLAIL